MQTNKQAIKQEGLTIMRQIFFVICFVLYFFNPPPKQPEQLVRCAGCGVFYPPDEIQAVYYDDDYPIHLCSNCS